VIRENQERKSGTKNRWWTLRLKLTASATKLHFQRPAKPYKNVDDDTLYYWLRGRGHFIKNAAFPRGKFMECNPKECLICAYGNPAKYGFSVPADAGLAKCESRPFYCVSGWAEHNFHLVEKAKDREVQQGEKSTYTTWEKCKGRNCKFCSKNVPKVFGSRFWYDFSSAAWERAIMPVMEKIGRFAKDGGYIYPLNYVCEECNHEFFDMTGSCNQCESTEIAIDSETHTAQCQNSQCGSEWTLLEYEDLGEDGLMSKATTVMECPNKKCKHQGYPMPNFLHSEGKKKWEAYDIYDVQLIVKKTGTGKTSETRVEGFEFKEPDPRLFDPKYQGGEDNEVAQSIVKRNAEPLDLSEIHSVEIPAVQASMLNMPNLFGGEAGRASQKTHKPFSRNKLKGKAGKVEDEDESEDEEDSDDDEDEDDDSDDDDE
jgi:hypothetical protein